jgi:hypothetical protein
MSAYDLAKANKETIADLLTDMKYIYPPRTNVRDIYSHCYYSLFF